MNSKYKTKIEDEPCPKNHKNIFDHPCHPGSNRTQSGIQLENLKGSQEQSDNSCNSTIKHESAKSEFPTNTINNYFTMSEVSVSFMLSKNNYELQTCSN